MQTPHRAVIRRDIQEIHHICCHIKPLWHSCNFNTSLVFLFCLRSLTFYDCIILSPWIILKNKVNVWRCAWWWLRGAPTVARWFFLSPTEVIKHLESHHCASPAYTPHARYCFSCLKNITKLVFRNSAALSTRLCSRILLTVRADRNMANA